MKALTLLNVKRSSIPITVSLRDKSYSDGTGEDALETVHIYVSCSGLDSNEGSSSESALQTVEHALSLLNNPENDNKNIVIQLMCGSCGEICFFDLHATLVIKNTQDRKLTITANENDDIRITGGKEIPWSKFRSVDKSDRIQIDSLPNILKVSFSEIGIDNLGKISTVGYYTKNEKWLEVFENEQPLTLARYPNQHYINISVPGTDGKSFTYESNRPRLWQNEGEIWCHGFWYWSWADKSYKVDEMDASKNWLSFSDKVQYGLKKGYYNASNPTAAGYHKQAGYFRFMNVLYELDQPGEYYVDRNSSVLYIWPLKNSAYTADDVIQVSIINTCIEISANSKNIELNGFTIEACRKFGVKAEKVEDIVFTRMKIQNTGSYGIVASGNGVKISKCVIRNNDGGIDIRGGDRRTLTSSGHEIVDNSITDFGRIGYVGSDGINVVAVGVVVRRNIICRGSYTGIHWAGNDNIFENNMVCDTCLYASDCGGFMTGREMTWCGNVIRRNYITGIQLRVPGAHTRGVMLDDQYSCILIEQNVFYNNTVHCNIGGGRDNIVRRNIFYNALRYSMDVDARGAGGKSNTPRIIQLLKRMPYQSNTWKAKYPKLALIDANDPSEVGNPEGMYMAISQISDDRNFQAALYGNFKPTCLLKQFVSENKFEDPVMASDCRPKGTVGPIAARAMTLGGDDCYFAWYGCPKLNKQVVVDLRQVPRPLHLQRQVSFEELQNQAQHSIELTSPQQITHQQLQQLLQQRNDTLNSPHSSNNLSDSHGMQHMDLSPPPSLTPTSIQSNLQTAIAQIPLFALKTPTEMGSMGHFNQLPQSKIVTTSAESPDLSLILETIDNDQKTSLSSAKTLPQQSQLNQDNLWTALPNMPKTNHGHLTDARKSTVNYSQIYNDKVPYLDSALHKMGTDPPLYKPEARKLEKAAEQNPFAFPIGNGAQNDFAHPDTIKNPKHHRHKPIANQHTELKRRLSVASECDLNSSVLPGMINNNNKGYSAKFLQIVPQNMLSVKPRMRSKSGDDFKYFRSKSEDHTFMRPRSQTEECLWKYKQKSEDSWDQALSKSDGAGLFRNPNSLTTPVHLRMKRKHRPAPLFIPRHGSLHGGFQSRLRSPRVLTASEHKGNTPPPYTPPPMLSPIRSGSGLFWSIQKPPMTPMTAPLTPRTSILSMSRNSSIGSAQPDVPKQEIPDDEEPPESDILPHVNIGSQYQAEIPPFNSRKKEALMCISKEDLVFDPEKIKDFSDNEENDVWTTEEAEKYLNALLKCDKDFFSVSKEIGSKSVKECIQFYYLWKKVCPDEHKRLRIMRNKRERERLYNLRSQQQQQQPATLPEQPENEMEINDYDEDSSSSTDMEDNSDIMLNNKEDDASSVKSSSSVKSVKTVITPAPASRATSPAPMFTCDYPECNAAFNSKQALNGHIRVHGGGSKSNSPAREYRPPAARLPKPQGSPASSEDLNGEGFPCKLCGRVFAKVRSRSAHMKSHRMNESDKKPVNKKPVPVPMLDNIMPKMSPNG
ncbi:unnamed protein product [Mytilus edulis]|uniref:Uncharacterized protein n=1 Tax=Mytilus edulis TaxID=6550 RepID=A0A8S3TEC4_MYTED|nr:unnamed protein product [Mytilus edulis]